MAPFFCLVVLCCWCVRFCSWGFAYPKSRPAASLELKCHYRSSLPDVAQSQIPVQLPLCHVNFSARFKVSKTPRAETRRKSVRKSVRKLRRKLIEQAQKRRPRPPSSHPDEKSVSVAFHNQRRIGAAETEAIGHNTIQLLLFGFQ